MVKLLRETFTAFRSLSQACPPAHTHKHTHTDISASILKKQYLHTLSISEGQALKTFSKNKMYVSEFYPTGEWLCIHC